MAAFLPLPSTSATTFVKSSRISGNSAIFSSLIPLRRFNSLNSTRLSSRRLISSNFSKFHVQATILQDDEEKVEVEKSFLPKTLADNEEMGNSEAMPLKDSTPNGFERWIIKLEQSINITLTDSVIKILDALYRTEIMQDHFSECVENHAFETYDKFIKVQGDELKKLPAPDVAVKYYTGGDLYLFENLYDVFLNIRDDEAEHCKTMRACQTHGNLRSPHSTEDIDDSGCVLSQDCEGLVDCIKKSVTTSPAKSK
uniref:Ubiquinol oxidase n=1 Tax=Chenopodium quinoa TaxID=63459 RepID=A0A803M1Q7_CHEQI